MVQIKSTLEQKQLDPGSLKSVNCYLLLSFLLGCFIGFCMICIENPVLNQCLVLSALLLKHFICK